MRLLATGQVQGRGSGSRQRCKPQWGLQPNERCQLCWLAAIVLAAKRQERGAATSDEPLLCALRIAQRKKKVQTRALRGSAQSFIGKKPYLNLRLRAASDFFLRLTDGFS